MLPDDYAEWVKPRPPPPHLRANRPALFPQADRMQARRIIAPRERKAAGMLGPLQMPALNRSSGPSRNDSSVRAMIGFAPREWWRHRAANGLLAYPAKGDKLGSRTF